MDSLSSEPESVYEAPVVKKSNKTIMKLQAEAGVSVRRTPSGSAKKVIQQFFVLSI